MLALPASVSGTWPRSAALALGTAVALAATVALSGVVSAQGSKDPDGDPLTIEIEVVETDLGSYLVGYEGTTLYYFTRDTQAGESRCTGGCITLWPPLLVPDGAELVPSNDVDGTLGVIERANGDLMATYRGRPLYYYSKDLIAGQAKGQKLGGVWFVAKEDGSSPKAAPAMTLETASDDAGTYLTDDDGRTLYYFANDITPGVSACSGDCLEAWPPLTRGPLERVAAGDDVSGVVGQVIQDDVIRVTYDGRPLYYFAGDEAAGDTNGHGFGDVWYVAAVDGSLP